MEEDKLTKNLEESLKKQKEFSQRFHQIMDDDDIDCFIKELSELLKKFNNSTLASYIAIYTMQAVAQAVNKTAQEQLGS